MAFTDVVTAAGTQLETVSLCVQHLSPGQSFSSFPGGSDLNSRHVGRGTKRGTAMQPAIGPLGDPGISTVPRSAIFGGWQARPENSHS